MVLSSSSEQAIVSPTSKRNRLSILAGIGTLLVLGVVIFGIYSLFFAGVNPGPSFLEELRAGTIKESDIRSVEILQLDSGGGGPFFESDN